jgi:tetratricopeptide (TPR) repeat protein
MGSKVPAEACLTDRPDPLLDKYFYLFLSGTILIALLLRIAALLSLKESIYFDFLLWDERVYHTWAKKIADGTYQSSSVYEMAPLPAYLMAFIYKIFSPNIIYIRFANIVFGVFTCYVVCLIGKEMASRRVGLFACLVACLYEPFIFYSIVPLKTSLSIFLFASMVYFFVAILNKASMTQAILLGIALGLVQNVRPNCVVLVPLIPLLIAWNYYKGKSSLRILAVPLILYVVGLFISNVPFMIRNYKVSGEFVVTASQSGFNLYIANNPQNKDPYYRPLPFATTSPFEQGVQFTIEASKRVGEKLSPQEASSYWIREVIKTATQQPAAFIWKIFQKTLALFNRFEAGDHYHIDFVSDFAQFFRFPYLALWSILPFGMAGMAANVLGSKKLLSVSSVFVLYGLTLIVFFPTSRFRLPMLTILIPFAVMGISNLRSYMKQKQFNKIGLYSAIAIGFFVVEFLPIRGINDMTAYYNTHAIILNSKGLKDEAIKYWEASSQMNRAYSAFANLSLAEKYYKKGDIQKAVYYLDKITEDSFAAAQKYALLGDMMMQEKQIKRAIHAYEKSLAINSGQRHVRKKLVKIFEKIDKRKAMVEYEKLQYVSSFYNIL